MREFFIVLGIIGVLVSTFWLGTLAGLDIGVQRTQELVAKEHLGQFYLDPKTGKVNFIYLDLAAYTNNLVEAITPQRVPKLGQ